MKTDWGEWSERKSCGNAEEEPGIKMVLIYIIAATGTIAVIVILVSLCIRLGLISTLTDPIPQPKRKYLSISHHCGENQMCKCIEQKSVQAPGEEEPDIVIEEI
ncbi:uncharacterized protein O3C94_001734 [Discoglossus pictus]